MKIIQRKVGILAIILLLSVTHLLAQESVYTEKDGFYLGLSTGTWFPDGKNKVFGHPIMGGLVMELKSGNGAVSLVFDIIVNVKKTDTLLIKYNNELIKRNSYAAGQIGLDFDYQLYAKNRFSIEAGSGLGYGNITYYNPNKDIDVDKGSLYVSPGLSFRYYVGTRSHFKFRTQYYIANYNLKDDRSSNFKGNYLTTKIIYAW